MILAEATKPRVSPAAMVTVAFPGLPPKQRMSELLTSEMPPLSRELLTLVLRTASQSADSGLPLTIIRGNLSVVGEIRMGLGYEV